MNRKKSYKKLSARLMAALMTAVILIQSGMIALAAEDIPGSEAEIKSTGQLSTDESDAGKENADEDAKDQEDADQNETNENDDDQDDSDQEDGDTDDEEIDDSDQENESESDTSPDTDPDGEEQDGGNGDSTGSETPEDSTEQLPEDVEDPDETEIPEEELPEEEAVLEEEELANEEELEEEELLEEDDKDIPEKTVKSKKKKSSVVIRTVEEESGLRQDMPIEAMTAEQIAVKNEEMAQYADLITPEIHMEDGKIIFSGELGYVENADGYYMAFRVYPDMEHFMQSGTIRISYLENGEDTGQEDIQEPEEIYYDSPESVWQDGYWDVIIPVPVRSREMTITVDNDGENPEETEEIENPDGTGETKNPEEAEEIENSDGTEEAENPDDSEEESPEKDAVSMDEERQDAESQEEEQQDGEPQAEEDSLDDAADDMEEEIVERTIYVPRKYQVDLSAIELAEHSADITEEPETETEMDVLETADEELKVQVVMPVMTLPVIKSVSVWDTYADIKFTPNNTVKSVHGEWDAEERGYYTLKLTDKVTGRTIVLDPVNMTKEDMNKTGYSCVFDDSVSNLFSCEVSGLSSNKAYSAVIEAHYELKVEEEGQIREEKQMKASKAKAFTTRKEMLTGGGELSLSYISMNELQRTPDASGTSFANQDGISINCNENYALLASVTNLSRALETEKLTWSVLNGSTNKAADKKTVTIKPSVSTYETQLMIRQPGEYVVTATSTMTKQKLAVFVVRAQQSESASAAGFSLQNELFYFYQGSRENMEEA